MKNLAITSYANVTLTTVHDVDMFETFNNQRLLNNETPAIKGIPHVFFTTPMLNLAEDNCFRDSYLSSMYTFHPEWLGKLSYGGNDGSAKVSTVSPFIKILYNSATNFEPKDATSKTIEVGETYYGYKLTLPASNVDSVVGDDFTVEFYDWKGLPVLNMLYSWFVYHNGVRRGTLNPKLETIRNRELDYVSSVYYFVTDMDGSTLLYWCKYTGVVPTSIPFSQFSSNYNDHDVIKFPVTFTYSFKEDMNPEILTDFNKIVSGWMHNLEGYYANAQAIESAKDLAAGSLGLSVGMLGGVAGGLLGGPLGAGIVGGITGAVTNSIVSTNLDQIYQDRDTLPVKYMETPTNDMTSEFDKNGYNIPAIIYGSYVPSDGIMRQTPTYRLVFTNYDYGSLI